MEYEYRLEGLFEKHPELQGICQYHADTLPVDALETALYTHRAYYINATLSQMNPYYSEPGFTQRAKIPTGQWKQMLASGHDQAQPERPLSLVLHVRTECRTSPASRQSIFRGKNDKQHTAEN
jgi:hypothetical protein